MRQNAVEALVYGNERWDGSGYPEGRRGSAIPRVARAFAVCRRYDVVAHNGDSVDDLRGGAAKELDPTMVQRFTAMLRAEKAEHNYGRHPRRGRRAAQRPRGINPPRT